MAFARCLPNSGRRAASLAAIATLSLNALLPASRAAAQGGGKPALPLALEWKYTATYDTNNPASPVVLGDSVYFACGDRVYAVELASGALKWRFPQDAPLATVIRSTPAITGDMLYVGADDGKLYALNVDTGKGNWLFDTRSTVTTPPAINEGVCYFGSADGRVFAVDTRTGNEVPTWRGGVRTQDEITGKPAIGSGMVYVLSLDQVLHAIGQATGKERVRVRVGGSVLKQSPVAFGDYVYVSAGINLTCYMGRTLTQRWFRQLQAEAAVPPAVTEDGVFVITNDNQVMCYEPRTGKAKWKKYAKLDYDVLAQPAVSGGLLFIGTVQGGVYALDTATGATKWIYSTEPATSRIDAIGKWTNIAASPVPADDRLFVLSDDGSLACFKTNAVDSTPPTISDTEPAMGVVINGIPPIHFEARVFDVGSGVNPGSVRLLIDGEGVVRRPDGPENEDKPGYSFDLFRATLTYDTAEPTSAALVRPLSDGRHSVTVVASDWAGNTAEKTWTITVDNSVAKLTRRRNDDPNRRGTGPGGMGPGGTGPGGMGPGGMGPGGMGPGGGRRGGRGGRGGGAGIP